jgi:alcohol dehydrogenase
MASATIPSESKAWRLAKPGAALEFLTVPTPQVRAGTVLVRMLASPLLSYLGDYAAGKLPYWYPSHAFTPGTNGIGIVAAVGEDVYHLSVGQRVAVHPLLVANEIVDEPAQALIGLTGISADSGEMIDTWADGTLREYVLMPASTIAPLDGLDAISSERLATIGKFSVPLGGLLRGRFAQGETLVVNGATGYFGSAAVLLGLALGAERVIATGRAKASLDALAAIGGARVQSVVLSGDVENDRDAIRTAAGPRGPHMAFDQVGRANDASSTLAALRSLRRGGRMVLMGSMSASLPITYSEFMQNDWELIGNFMYRPATFKVLVSLLRAGLLDLDVVKLHSFALPDLQQAIVAAANMKGLECTIVKAAA